MILDTPTPTPTETSTPIATATLTVPDRFYVISTIAPDGPEIAYIYETTAGEAAIFMVLLIMLILGAFGLFLQLRVARLLKRLDRS